MSSATSAAAPLSKRIRLRVDERRDLLPKIQTNIKRYFPHVVVTKGDDGEGEDGGNGVDLERQGRGRRRRGNKVAVDENEEEEEEAEVEKAEDEDEEEDEVDRFIKALDGDEFQLELLQSPTKKAKTKKSEYEETTNDEGHSSAAAMKATNPYKSDEENDRLASNSDKNYKTTATSSVARQSPQQPTKESPQSKLSSSPSKQMWDLLRGHMSIEVKSHSGVQSSANTKPVKKTQRAVMSALYPDEEEDYSSSNKSKLPVDEEYFLGPIDDSSASSSPTTVKLSQRLMVIDIESVPTVRSTLTNSQPNNQDDEDF